MRRSLPVLFVLLLAAAPAAAQSSSENPTAEAASDYAEIARTVGYYLDGGTNNDFETLRRAFHPTATMRFLRDGYQDVNAVDYFRGVMKPGPPQDRTTRIVSIDLAGDAAAARLEIVYPTFTFIDYMTLLRIDGEWLVVSKVFHRQPHPQPSGS